MPHEYKDGDIMSGIQEGPIQHGVEGGVSGTVRQLAISSAGAGHAYITNETIEQTVGTATTALAIMVGAQDTAGNVRFFRVTPDGDLYTNKLVPEQYDQISLAYDGSTLTSVVYINSATTVATLVLAYDGDNLTSVVKTET